MTFAGAFLVVVYLVRFLLFICARIFVCEGKMVFRLLAHLLICILPVRPVCLTTVLTIVEMDDFVTNIFLPRCQGGESQVCCRNIRMVSPTLQRSAGRPRGSAELVT